MTSARDGTPGGELLAARLGREVSIPVREEPDVAVARRVVSELAQQQGLPGNRAAALVTAVSEIARNIVDHAGSGALRVAPLAERSRRGVVVEARDSGPGIRDVDAALRDGHSTGRGLGLGLPSARRLVDEFSIASAVGRGTTVVLKQWADGGTR